MKKLLIQCALGLCLTMGTTIPASAQSAISNARYEWYFVKKGKEVPPSTDEKYIKLIKAYDGMFVGDPNKKDIYLTFDNGYENGYTDDVLNVLKEKKVPAAFFVTGHFINTCPDLIKRMVDEGHIVGNHTNHHPDMTTISVERTEKELSAVKEKYEKLTGKKDMHYLRPPRGVFSEQSIARSKQLGYTHVFWSLAFFDWDVKRQRGWQYAYDSIVKQIHPGSILLLHTVSKDNAEALGRVITELQKKGYTFKSLDEFPANRS